MVEERNHLLFARLHESHLPHWHFHSAMLSLFVWYSGRKLSHLTIVALVEAREGYFSAQESHTVTEHFRMRYLRNCEPSWLFYLFGQTVEANMVCPFLLLPNGGHLMSLHLLSTMQTSPRQIHSVFCSAQRQAQDWWLFPTGYGSNT